MVNSILRMKRIIYVTLLFFMSCGVKPQLESSAANESNISGEWKITSNKILELPDKDDFSKDGSGSFYLLFGAEYWGASNGKMFNLQEDGKIITNIVDSDKITQIDLRYKIINDRVIEFSCKLPKDTIRNIMPVKYEVIKQEMTWLIDDFLEIKLQKE